jgi:hypothetical protein
MVALAGVIYLGAKVLGIGRDES